MKKHIGLCCWVVLSDSGLMNEAMQESTELWVGPVAGLTMATLGLPPWGEAFDKYIARGFSLGYLRMADVTIETEGWPEGSLSPFIAWALAYDKEAPRHERLRLTEFRRQYGGGFNETQFFDMA